MSTVQNQRREGNLHSTALHERGGQASGPGLFGLPGNGPFGRRNPDAAVRATVRFERVPADPRPAPVAQDDDSARKIGGLSFGQRRALIQARVHVGAANFFRQAAAPAAPAPARPTLSMEELVAKYRTRRPVAQDDHDDATPRPTAFMLACAAASDGREAFPHHHDDEEAATGAFHAAGAGHIEMILAGEGC